MRGGGKDQLKYFVIEDKDGEEEEFTLDTKSPKTNRHSIIKAVGEWSQRRNPSGTP